MARRGGSVGILLLVLIGLAVAAPVLTAIVGFVSEHLGAMLFLVTVIGVAALAVSTRGETREQRQAEKTFADEHEEGRAMLMRHSGLVDRFVEIVERKVVIDEYGDENREALQAELGRVMGKIATAEGERIDLRRRWTVLQESLLQEFETRHAVAKAGAQPATDVERMTGVEFEMFLARLLREHHFENVRGTPVTGDQGADLLAERAGRKIVIQAKRYTGHVGNAAVQEVIAALSFYGGDEGWVITNSSFTPAARALAQKAGVRLIDGFSLAKPEEAFRSKPPVRA